MGILNILPALRLIQDRAGHQTRRSMYDVQFHGSRVAVDGGALLHRCAAGLGVAEALVVPAAMDPEPLCRKLVWLHRQMRWRGKLQTVTVFDGAAPPAKGSEKVERMKGPQAALERVRAAQQAGHEPNDDDVISAANCFLTPELVAIVVDALHAGGFTAHVALFEADGQLALMARTGQVDHVLTVDSDLIAHGCPSLWMIPPPVRLVTRVLRFGCSLDQMSADFGVPTVIATRAFKSTAKALSAMFEREFPRPSFDEIRRSTPSCFDAKAGTKDSGLMVDATGIQCPHPSNPELARTMWSEYYDMWAVIYQLGVTPGGCCVWVGPRQSPKLSDTQQCVLGGLLEFMWPGSRLVLDRGYKGMHFAARRRLVRVTMPAFRIRRKKKTDRRTQLGKEAMRKSARTAKNRSHNEREMSRLKGYRLFRQLIPMQFKDILDELVWVAVCLGNFKCPLTETDAWRVESDSLLQQVEADAAAAVAAAEELGRRRAQPAATHNHNGPVDDGVAGGGEVQSIVQPTRQRKRRQRYISDSDDD
eukprot:SAG31_NODE_2799_length_5080_cov_2.022485_4_plen_532_part_00